MKKARFIAAAAAVGLGFSAVLGGCGGKKDDSSKEEKKGEVNVEMTATELVKRMGNGINLGNTMEAYAHFAGGTPSVESCETAWGQPVTTQEMISGMKAAGFDSLRIPVAWTNAMPNFEEGDYTIGEEYLDRVEEIINYALNEDMYVIINDHWDGSWWGMFGSAQQEVRDKAMDMYRSMWTQIAQRYADYSDKLIFESANEELGDRLNDKDKAPDSGSLSQDECYETANRINQEFVDLVRKSGGNNDQRFLLIAGYNTDIAMTCDDRFHMPTDTAKNKLLLSVHYYTPWNYCGTESVDHWGSVEDYKEQNKLMKMMTKYSDQGYGIIIGEYAVLSNGGVPKNDTDKFYTNFLNNCDLYNYCPMLWDCSDLYKRTMCSMGDETLAQLFSGRSFSAQSALSEEEIAKNAQEGMDADLAAAEEKAMEDVSILPADDKAVAWIMYQSSDYNISYSVGDNYDPTSKTDGVKAENVEVTGEGTYTVKLDLSDAGAAKGVAFSALGISNGELLYPGYNAEIDEIKINGEPIEMIADGYTSSDDSKCTRVNLYNQWVSAPPEDARGAEEDSSATIIDIPDSFEISDIEITFTYTAP